MLPVARAPRERSLFVICFAVSLVAWLALLASVERLGATLATLLFVWAAHAMLLAQVRGDGVRLSERQLPHLYARCLAAAGHLGLSPVPEVYLVQSGGVLNAFATRLLSRRFVVLFSGLVDQCSDERELDFVIGHEMGHLAAGHLEWSSFFAPARLLPWLGPAYSRACEYTCDRCGYSFVGALEPSLRGLVLLAAGGRNAGAVELDELAAQRHETGDFWMAVRELSVSHPYLCKRVAALQALAHPGELRPIGRNPLAYLFAPVLGLSAMGPSSTLLMMILYSLLMNWSTQRQRPPNFAAPQQQEDPDRR
jgi:Zn-dependent protease with chaperone function